MYFTSPVSGGWLRTAPSLLLLLSLLTAFSGFGQTTTSFVYNGTNGTDGSPQFFTIPTGVTELTVVAFGAQGGGVNAGKGGQVNAVLTISQPQTLTIYVGGQPTSSMGGYNGGGNGVLNTIAGGGGGATDIRSGGGTLVDRILVAGGGGGYGFEGSSPRPGYAGGGLTGGGAAGGANPTGGSQIAGGNFGGTLGVGGNGSQSFIDPSNTIGGGGGGGY